MFFGNYETEFINKYSVWGYGIVNYQEYYRLITGAFLHAEPLHFIFNMYALYIIGSQMESFLGKGKYLIVYFFSTIVGSLFSIIFSKYASIGASGAIFGLLGSLLYFGYHYRVYLGTVLKNQIIPIIVINLAIGFFLSDNIDNFAHIGGLVGGVLITMGVGVKYKSTKQEQINGCIVSLLLIAFLLFVAFNYVNYSW